MASRHEPGVNEAEYSGKSAEILLDKATIAGHDQQTICCLGMTRPYNYILNIINNRDFFLYVKLLISKCEEIIDVRTVNKFKAKMKKRVSCSLAQ